MLMSLSAEVREYWVASSLLLTDLWADFRKQGLVWVDLALKRQESQ